MYGYGGLYDGYGDYEPYYGSYDTSDNPAPAPNFSNGPIVYPAARASYMAQPVTPVIHEYGPLEQPAATEPESAPVLFQLAFRDSSVKTASAYWVSDGTLYFMDDEHNEQHASLTSVDRARSTQLNRERHVPFNLQ
ncbi:MAG TPA: hypothetical protein VKR61_07215 [Bryobacteraceae bacterium]|nr:hypothetical protein [Bryobacteraceae bacterium]